MSSVATASPTNCLLVRHSTSESRCFTSSVRFWPQPVNVTRATSSIGYLNKHVDIKHQSCTSGPLEILGLSDVTPNDAVNANEHGSGHGFHSAYAVVPVMKKGYGAFGGGATLEKSKLDLSQSTTKMSPKTEDGSGGGDIGNKIFHGGGDGGDDGGDDDDYFGGAGDEDDGDDGGFFRRRLALPEVFDRKIVEAILKEWFRTIADLPAGLRQAFELGVISSAQMVRYISNFGRPTLARLVSRIGPPSVSRAFIGRMIADPSFLYKMYWEQAVTVAYGAWLEYQTRKERLKDEWGLALVDVLSLSLCNAAIVWSLAPCRSYGSTFKFNLQNTIQKLPNNIFERNYAFREFDMVKRLQSMLYKEGELCLTGLLVGTVGVIMGKILTSGKEKASVLTASIRTSALSYGAFLGLTGNLRYQCLYGMERVIQEHLNHISIVVMLSFALRALNIYIGDATRVAWLGLDTSLETAADGSQQAYHRPSLAENPLKQWSPEKLISIFLPDKSSQPTTRKSSRKRVKRRVMLAA